MKIMNPSNVLLIVFYSSILLLLVIVDANFRLAVGIGQPLRLEQMDDMRTIVDPLCNERMPVCRNLMTIVDSAETSVSQAQTEMQAGNTTGAMMMLSNAEQILSALRENMTVMVGGR
jgi:hypothetical protein